MRQLFPSLPGLLLSAELKVVASQRTDLLRLILRDAERILAEAVQADREAHLLGLLK